MNIKSILTIALLSSYLEANSNNYTLSFDIMENSKSISSGFLVGLFDRPSLISDGYKKGYEYYKCSRTKDTITKKIKIKQLRTKKSTAVSCEPFLNNKLYCKVEVFTVKSAHKEIKKASGDNICKDISPKTIIYRKYFTVAPGESAEKTFPDVKYMVKYSLQSHAN